MKKLLLALVFLSLLSMTFSAFAITTIDGPFSIRNDIHLGMSKDEVSAAETSAVASDMAQLFTDNHSSQKYDSYLRYQDITLAGQSGSALQYGFDADGKIKDITYLCGEMGSKAYNDMLDKLTSKYGSPNFKEPTVFDTEAIRCFSESTDIVAQTVNQFSGWLIRYSDCYISLELVNRRSTFTSGSRDKYDWIFVGYRIVTVEEYEEMASLIQDYKDSVNESVKNDL